MKNPRNAGRKKKYGVPTERMSLHVPQPLHDKLQAEAARTAKSKSEVVIETLEAGLPEPGAFK